MRLNETLAKKQKITLKQRETLDEIYDDILKLLEEEKEEKNIKETGYLYSEKMKILEFELQKNWNFPQDELCHTWRANFYNCTCPILDNQDRFGVEKIVSPDCPLHK
jgi:hypothetical protein